MQAYFENGATVDRDSDEFAEILRTAAQQYLDSIINNNRKIMDWMKNDWDELVSDGEISRGELVREYREYIEADNVEHIGVYMDETTAAELGIQLPTEAVWQSLFLTAAKEWVEQEGK